MLQSLQNAYQFEHHKATFLVQDSQTVGTSSLSILAQKIAPLRSCYIGISYIDKVDLFQKESNMFMQMFSPSDQ